MLGDGESHFTPGLSVRTGSESRFQHFGLKNIDAQTTASESISASRTYDAFGNTVASSGSWSGPFGYGGAFGYQSEPNSGLQLLGHRYYDPSSGRFLSRDKARDGRNWYGYCYNAPLTRADPTGQVAPIVVLAVLILSTSVAHAPTSPSDQPDANEALGWAKIDMLLQLISKRKQAPRQQVLAPPKKVPHQVTINRANGLSKEAAVRQRFINQGFKDVKEIRRYMKTPFGKRKHDFSYTNSQGDTVYVEVKSGGARYGGRQKQIDDWLRRRGTIVDVIYVP